MLVELFGARNSREWKILNAGTLYLGETDVILFTDAILYKNA